MKSYNRWHDTYEEMVMPKRKMPIESDEIFRERLARPRKAVYSLRELAAEVASLTECWSTRKTCGVPVGASFAAIGKGPGSINRSVFKDCNSQAKRV